MSAILQELYVVEAAVLFLGFASIILFIISRGSTSDSNVVYIEKFRDSKKATNEDDESISDDEGINEKIDKVKSEIQGINEVDKKAEKLLSSLSNILEASQAAIYIADKQDGKKVIKLYTSYAFVIPESQVLSYEFGEGLAGQVAKERKLVNISDIPEGYITVLSGLGKSDPAHLLISPVEKDDKLLAVVEVASFKKLDSKDEELVSKTVGLLKEDLTKLVKA
jgi:putative methionine-R-sulfoxide reductase with GAF domain